MQHSSISIHQPPQVGRLNNGNGSHSESKTSAISTGGKRSINTIIFPLPTESFTLPHSPPPRKATWKFNFQSRGRIPKLGNSPTNSLKAEGVTQRERGGDKTMLQRGHPDAYRQFISCLTLPTTQSYFLLYIFLVAYTPKHASILYNYSHLGKNTA